MLLYSFFKMRSPFQYVTRCLEKSTHRKLWSIAPSRMYPSVSQEYILSYKSEWSSYDHMRNGKLWSLRRMLRYYGSSPPNFPSSYATVRNKQEMSSGKEYQFQPKPKSALVSEALSCFSNNRTTSKMQSPSTC